MTRLMAVCAIVMVLMAAACGGGGGSGTTGEPSAAPQGTSPQAGDATEPVGVEPTTGAEGEVPAFLSDMSRMCETQVGFSGMTPYNKEPGSHPVALFEEFEEGGNWIETSRQLPKAWVVTQDANFEDSSELTAIELVGCLDITAQKPNGTKCDFDSDGKTVTLELVDANYELTVYEATTGEKVGSKKLKAASKECPFFATFEEGDTEFVNEVDDNVIINALKPHVAL